MKIDDIKNSHLVLLTEAEIASLVDAIWTAVGESRFDKHRNLDGSFVDPNVLVAKLRAPCQPSRFSRGGKPCKPS